MSSGGKSNSLGEVNGIWSALLDFATRVGSTDLVNQTPSSFNLMTDRDREFLTNAMAQVMKDSDPVRQMKETLDMLSKLEFKSPNQEQVAEGVAGLERIIELCLSLDMATDFHKLGGFRILVPLLASGAPEFRSHAAELVGGLSQNHPYCQKELHNVNILSVLLQLLDSDPDPSVRAKALFAVSCLIRSNDELTKDFINADGLNFLLRATKSDHERLSTKAAFLLSTVLMNPENKDKAIELGFVEQLASMIVKSTHSQIREHASAALLALIDGSSKAMEQCRKPELGLKKQLEDRLKEIGSNDEYEDERVNIEQLMGICWPRAQ